MADFTKLALIHGLLGIEVYTFGFFRSSQDGSDEEAMFIIGYLLFVAADMLMALLVFGELKDHKIATLITMAGFFSAGQ